MGFFDRLSQVWKGFLSLWISDIENRNPEAVYEAAIEERIHKHRDLKKAVSGIVYLRNKLQAELDQKEKELEDMMSQGLADAGFPPDMIQAGMDAGIANYTDAIAGGMSPADAFSQAANIGMDAGAQIFDDQMPDMDEIGMTAFQDAISNGAPPAEAAQSAANAISQAGQDFGIPPEMIEAGLSAGM